MEELKHVCRLCNKRYPSGKSLGGHMRSHVMANSSYALQVKVKKKPNKHLHSIAGGGDSSNGYGLRENPRKSWRVVVDANETTPISIAKQEERVCKQCGKAFQSSKALCGHMSSHSQRERSFTRLRDDEEDDGDKSWTCEEEDKEELAIESHSSNGSGIEQEQEDVALCLIMLSRDSANRAGFNFTAESSDNNSVVLEGGSSSNYAAKRKNLSPVSDFNSIGANVSVKVDLAAAKKKIKFVELENSDSGYFENEAKEQESDDSVDGYARNYGIKRPIVEDLSSPKSPPRKYQCSICGRSFKSHQALGGHIITHRRDADPHGGKNSVARSESRNADNKGLMGSKKVKGYCCPHCPKVFKSGQALGGHKRTHLVSSSSRDKATLIKSVEEAPPKIHHGCQLLDLNLPAPVEGDENGPNSGGHDQFMPW